MEGTFFCRNCQKEKLANPKLRKEQSYCSDRSCQSARKATWQRNQIKSDASYRESQKLSHEIWIAKNQDYWGNYRKRNPKSAERNRILQKIRNRKNRAVEIEDQVQPIAKMDALPSIYNQLNHRDAEYWLIPAIAKMDALKVKIEVITDGYT
jgi:hypothetical protein